MECGNCGLEAGEASHACPNVAPPEGVREVASDASLRLECPWFSKRLLRVSWGVVGGVFLAMEVPRYLFPAMAGTALGLGLLTVQSLAFVAAVAVGVATLYNGAAITVGDGVLRSRLKRVATQDIVWLYPTTMAGSGRGSPTVDVVRVILQGKREWDLAVFSSRERARYFAYRLNARLHLQHPPDAAYRPGLLLRYLQDG